VQIDGEPIEPADRKNLRFECLQDVVHILLKDPEAQHLTAKPAGVGLTEYHTKVQAQ
jgi:hypothetical protein